ncbi:MAG: aldehyde dehydrogenase family protein [Phycisphaerae bacterium]|nr:aldehyde dehydrogenase family protein [Phycisphaerae bacterium]
MGPLVDAEARDRVHRYIDLGKKEGATVVLDGRNTDSLRESVARCPNGCFVGPTIIDHCRPGMSVIEDEIFGPVLSVMREATLDAAIANVNRSKYGNMAVIFTSSGHDARRFRTHIDAGMLGINVGVPAPMAAFPFSGWKQSFFGDLHANGEDGPKFFTKSKVCVARWL